MSGCEKLKPVDIIDILSSVNFLREKRGKGLEPVCEDRGTKKRMATGTVLITTAHHKGEY